MLMKLRSSGLAGKLSYGRMGGVSFGGVVEDGYGRARLWLDY
jgi:hypothetical protein